MTDLALQPEPDWRDYALCKYLGTNLFFPERGQRLDRPKAICATCPVQPDCLEYVLRIEDPQHRSGVWGGTTPNQRRQMAAAPLVTP